MNEMRKLNVVTVCEKGAALVANARARVATREKSAHDLRADVISKPYTGLGYPGT